MIIGIEGDLTVIVSVVDPVWCKVAHSNVNKCPQYVQVKLNGMIGEPESL